MADNIKTDLREIGLKSMHWIHVVQNSESWRVLVNKVMNFTFHKVRGIWLANRVFSFRRKTLRHGAWLLCSWATQYTRTLDGKTGNCHSLKIIHSHQAYDVKVHCDRNEMGNIISPCLQSSSSSKQVNKYSSIRFANTAVLCVFCPHSASSEHKDQLLLPLVIASEKEKVVQDTEDTRCRVLHIRYTCKDTTFG